MNRRQFLINSFKIGGYAALAQLGVSLLEAKAIAGFSVNGVTDPASRNGVTEPASVDGVTSDYSLPTPVPDTDNDAQNVENFSTTNTVTISAQSGTNRCFIVGGGWVNTATTMVSLTYDGNGMTEIETQVYAGANRVSFLYYYCTDSGTGNKDVVLTISDSRSSALWVMQVDGCNTSSLVDTSGAWDVSDVDPQKSNNAVITTTDNCLLISTMLTSADGITQSVCDSTGQTKITEFDEAGTMTFTSGYFDHETAGEKYQCWQADIANTKEVAIIAAIKPAGS